MGFVLLNAVFAIIFLVFARRAIPRGLAFLRLGWAAVSAHAGKPDTRKNTESRQAISAGGSYLIAGGLWFLAGTGAGLFGLWFAAQAVAFVVNPL